MREPEPSLTSLATQMPCNVLKMQTLNRISIIATRIHDSMPSKIDFPDLHNFTAIAVCDE
jgi:hypothetical protein